MRDKHHIYENMHFFFVVLQEIAFGSLLLLFDVLKFLARDNEIYIHITVTFYFYTFYV